MKVLITGFTPFGGEEINPSYEAVKLLPDIIGGAEIIKLEVPTVFGECSKVVIKAIENINPDIVLHIGQAAGRSCITVEKVAINTADCAKPDNNGITYDDAPLIAGAPDGYFATVDVKGIAKFLAENEIPCRVSYTAGTYVCNSIMYRTLHYIKANNLPIKAGFIHVPLCEQQAARLISSGKDMPFMPLSLTARALELAVGYEVNLPR